MDRNRVGIGLSCRRLHRLAGRCDNSVPTLPIAPTDCSKIPAQGHSTVPLTEENLTNDDISDLRPQHPGLVFGCLSRLGSEAVCGVPDPALPQRLQDAEAAAGGSTQGRLQCRRAKNEYILTGK